MACMRVVICTSQILFFVSMFSLSACRPSTGRSSSDDIDEGFTLCGGGTSEGCPCEGGSVVACYPDAPLADTSTGEQYCIQGSQQCGSDGHWGPCLFPDNTARLPLIGDPELCGGCDPNCWTVHDCPVEVDLDPENSFNLRFDLDAQGLVLGGSEVNARYAYVANDPESTVTKIDLETGDEVGRYLVGLPSNGTNNNPSRTALDSLGNAYVANRAFWRQGSVTKIAGDRSHCVDRNLNGTIETSSGGADVKPWTQDECVLWTVRVGPNNSRPRALAIDSHDRVWVGLFNTRRFDILNAGDGSLIDSIPVDLRPYGAAISGDGLLWFPEYCCERPEIQYIDTESFGVSGTYRPPDRLCNGSYGIVVDTEGRVTLGGWPESCVSRFDPRSGLWEAFSTPDGGTRGVTIDESGRIWAASHEGFNNGPHWLTSWDSDGGNRQVFVLESGRQTCGVPIGVGADFDGNIWTPCQNTSRVARLDPSTGTVDLFSTGSNPYTYSDFTGFLRAHVTAPEGSYIRLHDSRLACTDDRTAHWSQLYWDIVTPAGTEIIFWGRTANRVEQLGLSPSMELARIPSSEDPADIEAVMTAAGVSNRMRYLEIRVQLIALDGETSPVFKNMDTLFYCRCECDADFDTCTPDCDCDPQCT